MHLLRFVAWIPLYLSVCPSVCVSVHLGVCVCVCVCVYLSVYQAGTKQRKVNKRLKDYEMADGAGGAEQKKDV